MRLEKYITEEKSVDDMLDLVRRDCSKWIKECGDSVAYRGMRKKPLTLKHPVRKDRRPLDSSRKFQEELDNGFQKKFGWKPRSGGMFCTGDVLEASPYGKPYVVFPIGDYRYIWSPSIKDLYLQKQDSFVGYFKSLMAIMFLSSDSAVDAIQSDAVKGMMKTYQDTNLNRALKSGREIMVDCKEYYAIRIDALYKIENPDAPFEGVVDLVRALK